MNFKELNATDTGLSVVLVADGGDVIPLVVSSAIAGHIGKMKINDTSIHHVNYTPSTAPAPNEVTGVHVVGDVCSLMTPAASYPLTRSQIQRIVTLAGGSSWLPKKAGCKGCKDVKEAVMAVGADSGEFVTRSSLAILERRLHEAISREEKAKEGPKAGGLCAALPSGDCFGH